MKDFIKWLVDEHYDVLFSKGVYGANKTPSVMLAVKTPDNVRDVIEAKAVELKLHVMTFNHCLTIME